MTNLTAPRAFHVMSKPTDVHEAYVSQLLAAHRGAGAEQYGRFLVDVFEDWARHDVGDVFVSMFDTPLAHWMGMHQMRPCADVR